MPRMKKQGGGVTSKAKGKEIFAESGTLGLRQIGGVIEEEWLRQLEGERGIRAFKTMEVSDATAFAAVMTTKMSVKQVPFWFNAAGDTDADGQAKEFGDDCLEDMESNWLNYLDEFLSCITCGFSISEIVYKLRIGPDEEDPSRRSLHDDGRIGWRKFAFRPQETLDHWGFDATTGELTGFWQRDPVTADLHFIPKEKMLHFVMNATKGSPEGVSQLRGAYPAYYKKHKLEEWELTHIQRNVAGIPKGVLPADEFKLDKDGHKSTMLTDMERILNDFYKNEETWFCLPSDVYEGTSIPICDIKLAADQQPSPTLPTTEPINRYQREIARTFMFDFQLIDKGGSYALAKEKTNFFVMFITSICDMICEVINRQAVPQLFKLNTWEGLSGLPKLVHGEVTETDAEALGVTLLNLMRAGARVFPNDELLEHIYDELGIPKGDVESTIVPDIAETEQGAAQPAIGGGSTPSARASASVGNAPQAQAATKAQKSGLKKSKGRRRR